MNRKTRFVNVSIVSEARDISVFKATKNVLDRLELFRFPGEGTALSNKRTHIRISSLNMSEYGTGDLYDNNNRIDRSNGTMEGLMLVTALEKHKIHLTE